MALATNHEQNYPFVYCKCSRLQILMQMDHINRNAYRTVALERPRAWVQSARYGVSGRDLPYKGGCKPLLQNQGRAGYADHLIKFTSPMGDVNLIRCCRCLGFIAHAATADRFHGRRRRPLVSTDRVISASEIKYNRDQSINRLSTKMYY